VKHAEGDEPIGHLESAIVFHAAVQHPAIIPLVGWFRTSAGLAIVHEFRDGLIVNDPLAPGARPRQHPESTYACFRRLPVDEIIRALDAVLDAHVAVANAGFVAVDFYGGAIIYDSRTSTFICAISTRIGPVPTARSRHGSMARRASWPLRSSGEAPTIDERTTVFTLGRCGLRLPERRSARRKRLASSGGEVGPCMTWHAVATELDPDKRFASVTELPQGLAYRMSDIDADQPERELAAYTRHRDDLLVRIVGVLQFMLAMAYSPSVAKA